MVRLLVPFAWRAAVMWVLLRLALLAVESAGPALTGTETTLASRLAFPLPSVLAMAAAVTALVFIDMAALRERAFIANLGADRRDIGITAVLTTLVLEAAVAGIAALA